MSFEFRLVFFLMFFNLNFCNLFKKKIVDYQQLPVIPKLTSTCLFQMEICTFDLENRYLVKNRLFY